jgi:hypothetical protein
VFKLAERQEFDFSTNMKRRDFISLIGAGSIGLLAPPIPARGSVIPAYQAEPKSTHTWLESPEPEIYAYDVDVRINKFPKNPDRRWLYYFALQVNFTGNDEWSHGGFQWAGASEFRNNNNKGINWGGGSDWAGYGGIGVTNTPFTWDTGNWYRYRCWRLDQKEGLWRWLFAVKDYKTGKEGQFGTVVTRSKHIKSATVWMETGYGVQCDTETADIEWRNPNYRSPKGTFAPVSGTATYNGTCGGAFNTQQGLVSRSPLQWFQATNSRRTTPPNARLWG